MLPQLSADQLLLKAAADQRFNNSVSFSAFFTAYPS